MPLCGYGAECVQAGSGAAQLGVLCGDEPILAHRAANCCCNITSNLSARGFSS